MTLADTKTGRFWPGHASEKAAHQAARHLGLKDYTVSDDDHRAHTALMGGTVQERDDG